MPSLPKGLFLEEGRKRYRVRLYHDKKVFHLSYHYQLEEALSTLEAVKEALREYRKTYSPRIQGDSVRALVRSIRDRCRYTKTRTHA